MRLFVALELDPELRRVLARAAAEVEWRGRAPRRVAEPRLHLTLRFVGETPDERLQDVLAAVAAATAARRAFAVEVVGLGAFPEDAAVRVLWAGLAPSAPLQALVTDIERELQGRRFPPEARGFTPHITLARTRGPPARLAAPLDRSRPRFGEQSVAAVTVMESRLSPLGPTYVPQGKFELHVKP